MNAFHMPLRVRVKRLPEFTSAKVSGPATLAEFVAFIAEFGAETHRHGDKRVLVDLLEVQNQFKFTDHFQIGEAAARELKHLERLASVVPARQITHTSEKVAIRQGLQLRVFTSMSEATRWLQEPTGQPAALR